jgi:hypothetical protein
MTSFKRFESKPLVKIIYTYIHCNLWRYRQFIAIFYLLPSLGVRHLSSVNFSHFKLLLRNHWPDQFEPNLAGMFLGWSSTKFLFFRSSRIFNMAARANNILWLAEFQRSSSLKLMNWLNPNCKWMIIGMSFSKFLFFMWIGNPRWLPPQDIHFFVD